MIKSLLTKVFDQDNKNVFWSFASKGFAAVAFILVDVFLARMLQLEQYGEWQYFYSTLSIAFVVTYFGIPQASQTYAARYNGKPELRSVITSSLLLRLLVSVIFTAVMMVLRSPLATLIDQPDFAPLLLLSGPLIFLMGISEYLKNVFIGLKAAVYHFVMNVFEFGIKLGMVIMLLSMANQLSSVVNAYTSAVLVSVVAGLIILFYVFRKAVNAAGDAGGHQRFLKEIWRYSLPLSLISIGFVVMTELNTQMLGVLTTEREVAVFGVGKQLTNKLPQISLALSMGTMPEFAQITAGEMQEKKKKFYRLLQVNLLIFVPIVAGIILLSPLAIPLVYGPDYREAVLPLQILSLRLLISTSIIFANSFLDYQGAAKKRAFNFSISILCDVLLNLYLIPRYGAIGAAVATTVSYIPYLVLNMLEVRRLFNRVE